MLEIKGEVFSGKGDGAFFVALPGYSKSFEQILCTRPYPGTLNLRVDTYEAKALLASTKPITIPGFSDNGRTFGSLIAYKVSVNNVPGFVIIPEKTIYRDDVFEVISETAFRDELGLADGDKVIISAEEGE